MPAGFPHSEISGSKVACTSPKLIAACHVLHRLHAPRHPPCALSSLTIKFAQNKKCFINSLVLTSTHAANLRILPEHSSGRITRLPIQLSKIANYYILQATL